MTADATHGRAFIRLGTRFADRVLAMVRIRMPDRRDSVCWGFVAETETAPYGSDDSALMEPSIDFVLTG